MAKTRIPLEDFDGQMPDVISIEDSKYDTKRESIGTYHEVRRMSEEIKGNSPALPIISMIIYQNAQLGRTA